MAVPNASLSTLRQLLAERFPQATRPASGLLPTGVPSVDDALGGLPRHALTELVCPAPSTGSQLFFSQLLATTRALPARVALIDAADQFDPQSIPREDLEHLLWVRCRSVADAMPVADLLAREANLDLVVLDFAPVPLPSLRRIPATTWYRLQRAAGQTDLAFLVFTPAALVPSAQLRLQLETTAPLSALQTPRPHLAVDLDVTRQRQRLGVTPA
ncbi:MAG: hypothetical protein K0R17_1904 [Rariglobus sp.]|nr:hypothetical protein [Rariglobus sp.]